MASEVVTRFRLETTQYDSALRDASEKLKDVISASKTAGSSLTAFSQKSVEAARSLGGMATGGRTAKEKVQELVKVFNSLAKEYNSLSETQKRSDFGKALGSSMQQLKERIKEAKTEMQNMQSQTTSTTQSAGGLGGVVEQLAGKVGLSTKAFSALGLAGAAAGVALKVAGDAFMQNESLVDEWGRTMQSARGLYEGFCAALSNGDLGGFFSRMDDIISKAREVADAMDKLGTNTGIRNNQEAYIRALDAQDRAIINNKKASQADREAAQRRIEGRAGQRKAAAQAAYQENSDVAKKNIEQRLIDAGFTLGTKQFKDAYKKVVASHYSTNSTLGVMATGGTKNVVSVDKYGETTNKKVKQYVNLDDYFGDEWRNEKTNPYMQAAWGAKERAYNTENSLQRATNKDVTSTPRYLTPSSGGGSSIDDIKSKVKMPDFQALIKATDDLINSYSGVSAKVIDDWMSKQKEKLRETNFGTELYDSIDRNLKGTNIFQSLLNYAQKNGIQLDQTLIKETWDKIVNDKVIPQSNIEEIRKKIEEGLGGKPVTVTLDYLEGKIKEEEKKDPEPEIKQSEENKDKKERVDLSASVNKALEPMQKMVSGLGQVSSGLQQMGIKLPSGIDTAVNAIQGLMSVIQGVTAIIQIANTSILALTAATNVNSTTNLIPLAHGGVVRAAQGVFVPGNNPSGDMVPALLNSGELVLNRAQQGNLAAQLEGAASGSYASDGEARLQGETIYFALRNYLRSRGKGDILTR